MVPRLLPGQTGDAEMLILKATEKKVSRGGVWFANKVARNLPDPLHFAASWVAGLQGVEAGEYVYGVTVTR
jgi:hypothetical protein